MFSYLQISTYYPLPLPNVCEIKVNVSSYPHLIFLSIKECSKRTKKTKWIYKKISTIPLNIKTAPVCKLS